jgi:hypothetical protein
VRCRSVLAPPKNKPTALRNFLRLVLVEFGFVALETTMNGLIYLVGLVVVVMFILSFLGLR